MRKILKFEELFFIFAIINAIVAEDIYSYVIVAIASVLILTDVIFEVIRMKRGE